MIAHFSLSILILTVIYIQTLFGYINAQGYNFTDSFPSIPNGISYFGRMYDKSGDQMLNIPYPLRNGYIEERRNRDYVDKDTSYIRLVAIYSNKLAGESEPQSLKVKSNHVEERTFDRIKIVLWTAERLTSNVVEVLIQGGQQFVLQTLGMKLDNQVSVDSIPTSLRNMFIPDSVFEIELEILSVTEDDMTRKPLCVKNNTLPEMFPCPSLILSNEMIYPSLIQQQIITTYDRFLSTTQGLFNGVNNPNILNWRYNNSWYGAPLFLDTRVLAINKKQFEAIGLKLPPPYADWGPLWSQWTWETLISYAQKLKQTNNQTPIGFFGADDEESRFVQMLARSYGTRLLNDQLKSQIDSNEFRTMFDATIKKMFDPSDMLVTGNFVVKDERFMRWKQSTLEDPLIVQPLITGSEIIANRNPIVIVRSGDIKNGLKSDGKFASNAEEATILPAFIPGFSFIGGSGLSIIRGSLNPSLAFGFVSHIISGRNNYILKFANIMGTKSPYSSSKSPFPVADEQITKAEPFNSPLNFLPFSSDFAARKPFRFMLMEYAFKNLSPEQVISRANQLLNTLSLPECSQVQVDVVGDMCNPETGYKTLRFTGRELILPQCKIEYSQIAPLVSQLPCGFVDSQSPYGLTINVLAVISLLTVAILGALTVYNKHGQWIQSVTINYLAVIFIGAIILAASLYSMVGPASNGQCISQVWVYLYGYLAFAGTMALAAILIINGRVDSMVKPRRILFLFAVVCLINFIFLVCWTLISDPPGADLVGKTFTDFTGGNRVTVVTPTCSYGNYGLLVTIIVMNVLLVVIGGFYAVKNRHVAVGFNEPQYLLVCLWLLIAAFIAVIPSVSVLDNQPDRLFAVALATFIVVMLISLFYFIPKIRDARHGQQLKRKDSWGSNNNLDPDVYRSETYSDRYSVSPARRPSQKYHSFASSENDSIYTDENEYMGPLPPIPEHDVTRERNTWGPTVLRSPLNSHRNDSTYKSFYSNRVVSDMDSVISFTDTPLNDESSFDEQLYSELQESMNARQTLRYADSENVTQLVRGDIDRPASVISEKELTNTSGWYRNSFMDLISDTESVNIIKE